MKNLLRKFKLQMFGLIVTVFLIGLLGGCAKTEGNIPQMEKGYGKLVDCYFGYRGLTGRVNFLVFKDSTGYIREIKVGEGLYYEAKRILPKATGFDIL